MTETCYLKRFGYYEGMCNTCNGTDENSCYNSRVDVEEELQHIHRLFAEKLESITEEKEDSLEDQFDFANMGMGMEKW